MKPKKTEHENWLQELFSDIEKSRGKPIAERWFVVEVHPPKRYSLDNGHGGVEYDWTRRSEVKVSPYFATKEEAEAWARDYEPDEGASFEFKKQTLYERVVQEWH